MSFDFFHRLVPQFAIYDSFVNDLLCFDIENSNIVNCTFPSVHADLATFVFDRQFNPWFDLSFNAQRLWQRSKCCTEKKEYEIVDLSFGNVFVDIGSLSELFTSRTILQQVIVLLDLSYKMVEVVIIRSIYWKLSVKWQRRRN